MKKLKLDVDSLEVQTFETSTEEETRGTVAGNESTNCTVCNWTEGVNIACGLSIECTEWPQDTCDWWCQNTE